MPTKSKYTRKRSRKRFSLRRVRSTAEVALSTLGAGTVIKTGLTGPTTSPYRMMSTKLVWSMIGLTEGEGPILVGFAHSNYSVTEIKECLEIQAAISKGLKIEQEKANRLVRVVGTFSGKLNVLNDGKPISTRLNWAIDASASGDEVVIFAYSDFGSALTTGAILNINGDLWVKDAN